ncbi:hypothetical protein GPECTOR_17g1007 [Gonium pectorale]|uniref:Uncharacterized protein n=1 Tax=Gonium pectorale TaxID=33097 RepID=A0A150GK30_GONPE|nr:hypothetical protein GPECTOR_17g1007 [Gonium pectorale]|eukprot:KXZ50134.1 hypothetical protein GPECTOR_17g1007 [Gonium pectorale]
MIASPLFGRCPVPVAEASEEEAVLHPIVKDFIQAFIFMVQPSCVGAPMYFQFWEILKNILSLQLADSECNVVLRPPGSLGADTLDYKDSDEEADEEAEEYEAGLTSRVMRAAGIRSGAAGEQRVRRPPLGETLLADLRDPRNRSADILKLVSFLYSLVFPGRSPSEQRELKAASDRYLEEKTTEWIECALPERKQQKALAEAKAAAQKELAEAKAAAQKELAEAKAAAQKAEAKALAEAMHAESEAAAQVIAKLKEIREKEGTFARNEITEQELAAAKAELLAAEQELEAKKVAREELQAAQKAAAEMQLQGE